MIQPLILVACLYQSISVTVVAWIGWRVAGSLLDSDQRVGRATVALGAALLSIVISMTIAGAVHFLSPVPVLITELLIAVGAWRLLQPLPPRGAERRPRLVKSSVAVLGLATLIAMSVLVLSLRSPTADADTISYHDLNASQYLVHGSLWDFPTSQPLPPTGSYPANGELLGAWLMLPTHNDVFVYIAPAVMGILATLAGVWLATQLGSAASASVLALLACMCSPVIIETQLNGLRVDLTWAAFLLLGVAAAWHAHSTRQKSRAWMLLCGLALGAAAGTKYNAIMAAGFVALLVIFWIRPAGITRRATTILLVPTMVAAGGFWYLRNWILLANPFPQANLSIAGHQLFAGRDLSAGYDQTLLQALGNGRFDVIGIAGNGFINAFGPSILFIVFGVAATLRGWHSKRAPALGVLIFCLLLTYAVTPFTASSYGGRFTLFYMVTSARYLTGALFLAAACAAGMAPKRLTLTLASLTLVFDALWLVARNNRSDLVLDLPSVLLIISLTAVVGGSAWLWPRFRAWLDAGDRRIRATVSVACATATIAGAGAAVDLLHHQTDNPILVRARALIPPSKPILLVDVFNVRALLGTDLSGPVFGASTGPQGSPQPFPDANALTAWIQARAPTVVAFGASPDYHPPAGWSPSRRWKLLGYVGDSALFFVPTP